MAETIEQKPLPSAGYGSLVFIVGWAGAIAAGLAIVALAIILGIISLGGLGGITFWTGTTLVTAFLTAFVLMINLGSKVVVTYLVGNWLLQKMTKQTETNRFVALLLGVGDLCLLAGNPGLRRVDRNDSDPSGTGRSLVLHPITQEDGCTGYGSLTLSSSKKNSSSPE